MHRSRNAKKKKKKKEKKKKRNNKIIIINGSLWPITRFADDHDYNGGDSDDDDDWDGSWVKSRRLS